MKIILASSSVGRKKVLQKLGLKFEVIPAGIDEEKIKAKTPIELVKRIAKAKALTITKKLLKGYTNCLIIAADSMVLFNGQTFGKPKTKKEATRFLSMLSGQTHEFITGLCVINTKTNAIYQKSCKTQVHFDKFTTEEIEKYIRVADVTSYAGGYTYELKGSEILRPKMRIVGSESNMAGLPLGKLVPILRINL